MIFLKKAIVSGANGFVGSALVKELLKHNIFVIALGRNDHFDRLPKNNSLRCVSAELSNITNLKEIVLDRDIDTFYHFAWAGSAGTARADTALQLQNAQWTVDSMRAAKEIGCRGGFQGWKTPA